MKYNILQDIYLFGVEILHLLLYWIAAGIPLNNRIWVFGSWFGWTYNDNSKYLFEYVSRNLPDITAVWLSRNKALIQDIRKKGFNAYYFYSILGIWYALRAGIAIFSVGYTSDLPGFCISKKKKLIQLWHGAFLKKFGVMNTKALNTTNRLFPSVQNFILVNIIRILSKIVSNYRPKLIKDLIYKTEQYKYYTFITALSPIVKKEYMESFGISRTDTSKVIITGFPRDDILIHADNTSQNNLAERIQEIHGLGGSVGFYLPTHRLEGAEGMLEYIIENLKPFQKMMEDKKIYILIKLHQFHQSEAKKEHLKNIIVVTEDDVDADVYPLLSMTDFLITDYSGIYFDYLLVDKPIIYLIYDFDRYINMDREFYFPFEKVTPGPKVRSWNQLVSVLDKEIKEDTYKSARRKLTKLFHVYSDGNSSKRVADKIHNSFIR